MSGFVYNDDQEEAAGKVGRIIATVASIALPFVGLPLWATIAASAAISAATAYAGGARGGDVWRAGITGGVTAGASAGLGGLARGTSAAASAGTAASSGLGVLSGTANAAGNIASSLVQSPVAIPGTSGSILNGIARAFGNVGPEMVKRIGAAVINAAVSGQDMGRLNGLVRQQKAELDALAQTDNAAYQQKIMEAQKVLHDADKMDPAWHARLAMADIAGVEKNEFNQAMRNIMTKQGGSFDAGQKKAYERGAALHTARSKSLAYNQAYKQATLAQNQLRLSGAGMLGPNEAQFRNLAAKHEIEAGQERANRESRASAFGGISDAFFSPSYRPATSPVPRLNDEDRDAFFGGVDSPFGPRS